MEEGAREYLFENLKIKQDSIFDFEELYQRLFSWFEVMGYDFYEKGYEKHEQGGADNLKIFWEATKKASDYTKFVIEVNFFILGISKVDIEKEGLKIKTNKCNMEIRMSAYLIKDVGDKMKKSVGNFGRKVYERYIARERMEDNEIQLYKETHLLLDEIKGFTSMHTF
tara:strand:+ start:917 stop:1420 length:504 start_codon:yes stop_codon:yes gene_type:complete